MSFGEGIVYSLGTMRSQKNQISDRWKSHASSQILHQTVPTPDTVHEP